MKVLLWFHFYCLLPTVYCVLLGHFRAISAIFSHFQPCSAICTHLHPFAALLTFSYVFLRLLLFLLFPLFLLFLLLLLFLCFLLFLLFPDQLFFCHNNKVKLIIESRLILESRPQDLSPDLDSTQAWTQIWGPGPKDQP